MSLGIGSCSLINSFDDVVQEGAGGTGAAGSGGSGATGGGATGGGATGGGATGGGGAGSTYACDALGPAFQVLGPVDLGVGEVNEDLIVIPGDGDKTHVIVRNGDTQTIIARSLRDENLGPVVTVPNVGRLFDTAVAIGDKVFVPIELMGDPHLLQFNVQNEEIVSNPAPSVIALPDLGPVDCIINEMSALRDAQGNLRVAISCEGAAVRFLWGISFNVANQTGAVDWQLSGPVGDGTLELVSYAFVGGQHVVFVGIDDPLDPLYSLDLRVGPDATALGNTIPIQIVPDEVTLPLALLPNATADGIVLFALSLNPTTFANVGMWAGNVPIAQVPNLGNDPQGLLAEEFTWSVQADLAVLFGASHGQQGIVSAGTTMFDPSASRVELFHWSPDGALRVPSVLVDEIDNPGVAGRHGRAQAVPGNVLSTLVVWTQELPGGGNSALVRARRMQCSEI